MLWPLMAQVLAVVLAEEHALWLREARLANVMRVPIPSKTQIAPSSSLVPLLVCPRACTASSRVYTKNVSTQHPFAGTNNARRRRLVSLLTTTPKTLPKHFSYPRGERKKVFVELSLALLATTRALPGYNADAAYTRYTNPLHQTSKSEIFGHR